ncbi:SDR family oxidoreductase [Streptomyces physcomitrii]|uniref:SDR family oxidoreductase n=1 Tax=Streptomyces physcomitrii TaxID=2724184 RepID=A0ABX1HA03_9ACTN|nr:SDR family oxidoreductase [Streptomyces physcomitrii]NKI44125.1 SDR family oxidoreductase [Streptomyces physcomitrii]
MNGKVALVTGGSRGIGAATALRLAEEGADVALTCVRGEAEAEKVCARIEALGRRGLALRADAGDAGETAGAVERTVAALGRLDVLVEHAGIGVLGPGGTLYAMSKAALGGLTKALARELGPRGITADLVHPGPVDTDLNPAEGPYAREQSALTALGRFGTAEEIAATVAHLAGPGGAYLTGAEIAVDGGHAA